MLRTFWEEHPDAETPLRAWYELMKLGTWTTPNELKASFPSASLVGDGRVVFNVKGNSYRLIVRINYPLQICFTRFVGTHAAYDDIDATSI